MELFIPFEKARQILENNVVIGDIVTVSHEKFGDSAEVALTNIIFSDTGSISIELRQGNEVLKLYLADGKVQCMSLRHFLSICPEGFGKEWLIWFKLKSTV